MSNKEKEQNQNEIENVEDFEEEFEQAGQPSESEKKLITLDTSSLMDISLDEIKTLGVMEKFLAYLVQNNSLPPAIKNPSQAMMILLAGRELGMKPMSALTYIYMIEGRIAFHAQALRGIAIRHGVFPRLLKDSVDEETKVVVGKTADGKIKWGVYPNKVTEYEFKRKMPTGDVYTLRMTYTKLDAQKAGLLKKKAWIENEKAMLRHRCFSMGFREIAADVFFNSATPYEVSELGEQTDTIEVEFDKFDNPVVRDKGANKTTSPQQLNIEDED